MVVVELLYAGLPNCLAKFLRPSLRDVMSSLVSQLQMVEDDTPHRRGRSGTLIAAESAVGQEEDLNSQRRRNLLIELGQALGTNEVPASFWACLQVCDIERLEYILQNARVSPFFVSCFADTCVSIPHAWMQ